MDNTLKVGAKHLASMVLPTFCPRCFWYRLHCGDAPFSIFPSIFNDIDLYTKKLVHANIDKYGHPPEWLGPLSEAEGYKNVGFLKWHDEENEVILKGGPDAVFHGKKGLFVGDYKTARYGDGQDRLLPQYKVQLLGYAFLLVENGYEKPKRAALIYFEPPSDPTFQELLARTEKDGMGLPLSVEIVEIKLGDFRLVHDLIHKAREIYDQEDSPDGREGCKECMRLDRYIRQAENDSRPANVVVAVDKYTDARGKRLCVARRAEKGGDSAILAEDTGEWFPQWAQ